jgi:hypothetical protein
VGLDKRRECRGRRSAFAVGRRAAPEHLPLVVQLPGRGTQSERDARSGRVHGGAEPAPAPPRRMEGLGVTHGVVGNEVVTGKRNDGEVVVDDALRFITNGF